jgi:hypothetical protein
VVPSLGLGLAVGRFWAAAVPLLVAAPYALAGDDGSNAFAYRLPARGLGIFALTAAVLVLTGVLLRTGRLRPSAWVGAALLALGAIPLVWAGYRQLSPLDEPGTRLMTTSFRGVSLEDTRAEVAAALGPAPASRGSSIAPLGEDFAEIGGPPFVATSGSTLQSLRYRGTTVLVSDDRVYGILTTDAEAETAEGVGVGDNLEVAEDAYPNVECGVASATEYRTFPYCGGRLAPGRWIWFGQDPIRSILVATTEVAPD